MPLIHRGYSVQIEVDGEELSQYQVERTDERTITCWIPSENGKEFSVRTETVLPHVHQYKCVHVFADGRKLQGFGSNDEADEHVRYRKTSAHTRQPFVFSEVTFELDDEGDGGASSLSEDIGVIEVRCWPARAGKATESGHVAVNQTSPEDHGIKLSEKSKLIGANHVRPGATQTYHWKSNRHSYFTTGKEPYAIFRFKHRPKELLQALGVMPHPPTRPPSPPVASTSTRTARTRSPTLDNMPNKRQRVDDHPHGDVKPVISDEDEDIEARRRRIEASVAALQAELAGLGSQDTANTRVKAERAPSPIHVPQHGEVIDLTDD
ncbi:hypothetical protein PENSPDRAFT_431701 [Peniophora sp. CONT]|nr:hypothetical protein PENSPDRAFT_431701 [Peniophora sp. CONT]